MHGHLARGESANRAMVTRCGEPVRPERVCWTVLTPHAEGDTVAPRPDTDLSLLRSVWGGASVVCARAAHVCGPIGPLCGEAITTVYEI